MFERVEAAIVNRTYTQQEHALINNNISQLKFYLVIY